MWEYITGAITTPVETLRQVAQKKYWREGLLLAALSGLIKGATNVVMIRSIPPSSFSGLPSTEFPFQKMLHTLQQYPLLIMIDFFMRSILFWLIAGVLCFWLTRLFKGEGTLGGLLASLGFASSPNLLGGPIAAVFCLFESPGIFLSSIIIFMTGVWVLTLEIASIRESTRISTGAAIATFLTAYVCFLLIGGLVTLFPGS